MLQAPRGLRLHIAILGRRNVGKSSILNAITQQQVAIVSSKPGTTTDPVEKPMELPPIGPVMFIDTAGLDDVGSLGKLRLEKTQKVLERADLVLLVTEANVWGEYEEKVLREVRKRGIPLLVLLNKVDIVKPSPEIRQKLQKEGVPFVETCAVGNGGEVAAKIKQAMLGLLPEDFVNPPPIISDIVKPGDLVTFVMPIDLEAPKGRLKLPPQQTMRELLDQREPMCLVVNEKTLKKGLETSSVKPRLVVTDTCVLKEVVDQVPPEIPVTSFSILLAKAKGDLREFVEGIKVLDRLKPGDKVLIAEACTHHPIGDDMARVRIPRLINQKVGGPVQFDVYSGHDFPENLEEYKLVIHCGACMINRRELLSRILKCREKGVPITNYSMVVAYLHGCLDRVLQPLRQQLD